MLNQEQQRATAAGIGTFIAAIGTQVAAALGGAVGEGLLSDSDVYGLAAAVSLQVGEERLTECTD